MNHQIFKIINFITDTIFPKFCLGCDKEGQYLCPDCSGKIELNVWSACYKCGKRTLNSYVCSDCKNKAALSGLLVAGNWENELLRQLIYEYKYRFIAELKKELSQTLINYIEKNCKTLISDNAIISFVPLHKNRFIWRGFNQAELLAKEISERFNLPMVNLIERSRNTTPQAEIKKQEKRQENIRQSFIVSPALPMPIQNKIILLIDDVCTTGATLEECARTLKSLRPKEIWGLVLARG